LRGWQVSVEVSNYSEELKIQQITWRRRLKILSLCNLSWRNSARKSADMCESLLHMGFAHEQSLNQYCAVLTHHTCPVGT
jgi:hypothetical protein